MKIEILPSLLAADFGKLSDELLRVRDAGADAVHLDIMDAHFVPNLSFGPDVVALSRRVAPTLYRHVHLMLTRPDRYIAPFLAAGAQTIQIHVEADCDIYETLRAIRAGGARAAVTIRPQTPVTAVYPYLPLCDEVLIMTVNPGYGGQSFMADMLPKFSALRCYAQEKGFTALDIMVDGGITFEHAAACAAAGANQFVAGSFLFKQQDMRGAIAAMRTGCEGVYGTRTR